MAFNRLKDLRKLKGLKQIDICKVLNVDQSTYSDYETGGIKINIEALVKLADLYETNIDYIVNLTDEKRPYPKVKKKKKKC